MKLVALARRCLVVGACVLAMPAVARALPGDPPVTPIAPADGATVPGNADGIPVSYQCPPYTSFDGEIRVSGDSSDYQVRFSNSPALGADSRLATQPYGSDQGGPVGADGNCTAKLDTDDTASSPEIVGGRVFWQVYRPCDGCDPRFEVGPVRSFVVRPSVTGTLRTPTRVYAGYQSVFALESSAKLSGADVKLQVRAGRSWKTVVTEPYRLDRTELIAKLPAGRRAVRAVVVAGASTFTLASRTLTVRRAGRRATSRRDDGRYTARTPPRNSTLEFKVAGGGRTLRGFKASLTAFCIGPSIGDNRLIVAFALLDSAPIAPDGSVTGLLKTKNGARVLLTGRLRGGRFKGEVQTNFSTCSGSRKLDARRTG